MLRYGCMAFRNIIVTYKLFSFILLWLTFILGSCTSMYMPNVPTAALLTKKSEFYAGAHLSLKGNVSLNTAYAVNNHFGVFLNGATISRFKKNKDFRQNLIEIGAGYFTTFKTDNTRILEIYAGIGNGSTDRNYREINNNNIVSSDNQVFNFNKVFMQVNYTTKKKKRINIFGKNYPLNYGTVLRVSYLNIERFARNDILQPTEGNVFLEPIFFTRFKISKILQLQYTSGSNIGLGKRKFLTAGNSIFTIGLVANVGI